MRRKASRPQPGWMRNEAAVIVERDGRWHIAYSLEVPGANGQDRTKAGALRSLADAIALIQDDRRRPKER